MKKPYYLLTAKCRNPKCNTSVFTVERKRVVRMSESGTEYETRNVVCPGCRTWADVTKIKQVR